MADENPAPPSPWRRRRGRPSKFTPARAEKFLESLQTGAPESLSCRYVGWGYSTYRTWIVRAETDPECPKILRDFLDARNKALADGEMALYARLRQAAETDPKTALAILERRFPDTYGRQERMTMEGGGGTLTIRFQRINPEEVKGDDGGNGGDGAKPA